MDRGTATFRPMSVVAKRSPISATAELLHKRLPKCSAVAEMDDYFAIKKHGPKIWGQEGCAFLGGGELQGPHVTQCLLGRGLPPYQVTS